MTTEQKRQRRDWLEQQTDDMYSYALQRHIAETGWTATDTMSAPVEDIYLDYLDELMTLEHELEEA